MLAQNSSFDCAKEFPVNKILIVEDDPAIREAFSIILQLSGDFEVTTAENGLVAIALCHENTYDLILLDIMMPVLDGTGFLKEYTAKYSDVATKIIIMSNLSSGSELSIAQDFGVDRLVLKSSLTPDKLLTMVTDVLKMTSHAEENINMEDDHTIDDTSKDGDSPISHSY